MIFKLIYQKHYITIIVLLLEQKFYSDIYKASKTSQNHQKLIVEGDFNATTGVAKYKGNFDGKKIVPDIDFNDNGMRLKQFCRTHALNISSAFFKHRLLHRQTWYSNDKKTRKIIDYILYRKLHPTIQYRD